MDLFLALIMAVEIGAATILYVSMKRRYKIQCRLKQSEGIIDALMSLVNEKNPVMQRARMADLIADVRLYREVD